MKNKSVQAIQTLVITLLLIGVTGCKPWIPSLPPLDMATLTPDQLLSLKSLKKVDDYPLYTMNHYGGYDQNLRQKIYRALKLSSDSKRGCSTFTAVTPGGEQILARNHDFFHSPALILFTSPPNGYKSVSIVDLSLLRINGREKTDFTSFTDKASLLYAPFAPCDGMNEYGLAIGQMYAPEATLAFDPTKKTIFSLEAVRMMLDHAKTTVEAIDLLGRYNIYFPVLPSHYLITDASGDTVLIEFIKGKMRIIRHPERWQVATNFQMFDSEKRLNEHLKQFWQDGKITGDINGKSYWRYLIASNELQKSEGIITPVEAMNLLEKISLAKISREVWMTTQWSVVYNTGSGDIQVAMGRKYNNIKQFSLNMKHK